MLIIPDEIQKKIEKVEPYEVDGKIPDDAPSWVKDTKVEIDAWFNNETEGVM